jgi:hypothetical protein
MPNKGSKHDNKKNRLGLHMPKKGSKHNNKKIG